MRDRTVVWWLIVGWIGYAFLPWYAIDDGFWSFEWLLDGWPLDDDYAPARLQVLYGKWWLAPIVPPLLLPLATAGRRRSDPAFAWILIAAGLAGLGAVLLQGFAIGIRGWQFELFASLLGPLDDRQFGMGYGGLLVSAAFLFLLTRGIAARGAVNGDVFVVGSIGLIIALVAAFIFFPVTQILISAVQDNAGALAPASFAAKLFDGKIWGLACLHSRVSCGVAWNSLFLALLVGAATTLLGLAFALVATRTEFPAKRALRVLTVLPIITPPFVIGLAVILLFGRSGAVTQFLSHLFDIPAGRWVYGLPGIWFAQMLAFTPIARPVPWHGFAGHTTIQDSNHPGSYDTG
jgi:iron(III) transport system permease protein